MLIEYVVKNSSNMFQLIEVNSHLVSQIVNRQDDKLYFYSNDGKLFCISTFPLSVSGRCLIILLFHLIKVCLQQRKIIFNMKDIHVKL